MWRLEISRFLFLAWLLAACAPSQLPSPGPIPTPTASPQPEDLSGIGEPLPGLLLQYDIVPTFWFPEQYRPSGRVPPFSLFEDGTLVYVQEDHSGEQPVAEALYVRLSQDEVATLVEQVLAMGFERLESHLDSCPPPGFEDQSCLADGVSHIYRVRLPSGQVRQVGIYEHFANDPGVYDSLRAFLGGYRHPDADLYVPELAALFIVEPFDAAEVSLRDWPFDPAWLTPPEENAWMWGRVLAGEELGMVLEQLPSNMDSFHFDHQGRIYRATFVPWLPGADYSEEFLP